jgi:hypothetical protein
MQNGRDDDVRAMATHEYEGHAGVLVPIARKEEP